jgi:DNA-binding transcriptional regulator LsrR (DeoR family)
MEALFAGKFGSAPKAVSSPMARIHELRLTARIARMYYTENMKQSDIAERLHISQTTISRLLRKAREEDVVRISVNVPGGTYPELEERLQDAFGLSEVVVAECGEDREEEILARIGEAAAHYVETTLERDEVIGISSWSESLLRMVDNIHPIKSPGAEKVVQILGGMGNPSVQAHATNLTVRLAKLTRATPLLLSTQGVASSVEAKAILSSDPFVRNTINEFARTTMALVGIGAVEPSKLLADSGNVFTDAELTELGKFGAVGDICLHFFDEQGRAIHSSLEERVIGITLEQLRGVRRVVGVAGGGRKVDALLGALRGSLIDVLITDRFTAAKLVSRSAAAAATDGELVT